MKPSEEAKAKLIREKVLFGLRSGLPTHLCSPSFKGQWAFSTQ